MRWMALYLVFMIHYSTWGIDVSMISFCFRSKFICLYEHILQFYNLWYCDLLHITLLKTKMDPIRFHLESIDGLPCQEFMRRFVFAIVVLLSNYDVHLLSFIFEINWQGIYLKYEEIYVYTSRPLSWGVASFSLRYLQLLVSLDILAAWCNRDIGAYPLCRSYPIFFTIFIGVQSHHFHRHSEPPFS